jgi:hypothetical protein
MPFEKGHEPYKHETPWISGEGRKITKVLPPALIKAFNGLTNEGKAFGLLCERLAMMPQSDLDLLYKFIDSLKN